MQKAIKERIQPEQSDSVPFDLDTYLRHWRPQPLDEASALPLALYTSEAVYQREREAIFGKRWLYVGHLSQLPQPGSYFTLTIADQPLLLVRDLDGQVRGFFNVCPHRAGPVALDTGHCHRFTCLYHAWTFDLKGELKAMPYMAEAKGLNPAEYGLQPIQVEIWDAFIFVNLDPHAAPLALQLGNLMRRFERYQVAKLVPVQRIDYEVKANWKLYIENSSESYHAMMVHPSLELFKALDRFEFESHPHYYVEYFPFLDHSKEHQNGFQPGLYINGLNDWEMSGTSVAVLYPNMVLVTCPNFVLARRINPSSIDKTHVCFEWFVPDTEEATSPENVQAVVSLYDAVVREDLTMLDHVQQRMRSLHYRPGRLSPALEVGVHQFQQTLIEYLRGGEPSL